MNTITAKQLETLRAQIARRTPGRRLHTRADAERFVKEVGFCFFWPIAGIDMPNLFHAIAGRIRSVPNEHDDPDISKCWGWKDESLGLRLWYYAKLLGKRATLISLDYLPYFYAVSPNYGGEDDYRQEYKDGLLTREAKDVYEALLEKGALDTVRLRKEAHMSSDNAKARFERALTELQVGMKVLPIGVAEAGAWRYAFVYELVTRHFPELPEQARPIGRGAAQAHIVRRYLDNVVLATRTEVAHTFAVLKWSPRELDRTLAQLVEREQAVLVRGPGQTGECYASAAHCYAR